MFYQNKLWLLLIFLTFTAIKVNSQSSISLKEELELIEKKFNVKFSYVISNVDKVIVQKKLSDYSTLDEILSYLNSETFFKVIQIDKRYISIAPKLDHITICGYLIDLKNNPISNANIVISGTVKGAVTNEKGKFILDNLKISDNIEFIHLGYRSIIKNVNQLVTPNLDCITLIMSEEEIELSEVSIKNYIANSLSKLKDGTIQLDTKKFDILSGQVEPDLLQTSQLLPGVESVNESISNINVRSGASDQNVILWDNIKMYNPTHFFGLISGINPYLTNNISIIKNGTSAKYNDGVSGTIILKTDDNIQEKTHGGFGVNFISFDGFIALPINDKLQFKTSFRRSINEWINTPTYKSYFKKTFQNNEIGTDASNTDFNFYDVNVSLLFKFNKNHHFKANYIKINNRLNYFESLANDLADKINQNSDAVGLTYNLKMSTKIKAEISGYHSKYSLFSNNYQNNQQQLLIQENEVIENSVKAIINYTINHNIQIESGYQLNETGVLSLTNVDDPLYNRIQKSVMLNHSVFTEANYTDKNWFIRSGVRFNYFDKIMDYTIEPRINISRSFGEYIDLNVKYETKSQYTSQVVDFLDDFLGVESRRWVISDKKTPLVKSSQISVGSTFKKNKFLIDLSFFHKEVNGILISGQGFHNQIQDKRLTGEQNSDGFEFLLNKRYEKSNFWLSYTLSKSELLFKQISDTPFPSNNDIRHSSTLGFNYHFNKRLNTSVSAIIKSGNPFTKVIQNPETTQNGNITVVNYDSFNKNRHKPYNRFDFSINYNFLNRKTIQSNLKFGILNLLNKKQVLDTYYVVDENDSSKAKEINIQSLSFTPNLSLRVTF